MKNFAREVAIVAAGVALASLAVIPVASIAYRRLTGRNPPSAS